MLAILDTNHFQEYANGSELGARLRARINVEKPEVFSCIVAAEESLSGWVAYVRKHRAGLAQLNGYERLQTCIGCLSKLNILPFDRDAAMIFHSLQSEKLGVGTMDLKIAAISLAHDATLLSRNHVDFQKVPGLRVENWLD
jgi:tRNA(fMet)-specific endonuclease VapC